MSLYTVTKLKVREDAHNKATNEDILNANHKYAEKLLSLGFIAGGMFAVAEGDTYTGTLRYNPEIGKPIHLDGREFFISSNVVEIKKESRNKYIIKTQNSVYKLEKVIQNAKKKKQKA